VSEATHPVGSSSAAADPTVAPRRLPLWLMTLGAGLAAGLIGWAHGEMAFSRFRPESEVIYPPGFEKISGYQRQAVVSEIMGQATQVAERKKAAASFGLLGLLLGAGLGLLGGWADGSARRAGLGAVVGGLAGALSGAGLSWAAVPLIFRYQDPESGLMILAMTHAAIFIAIGGTAGLGLGLGLGDGSSIARALMGGLLGGFMGTVALEAVVSLAFPLMRTFEPIASEQTPRLLLYLCVAVPIALLAGLATGKGVWIPRASEDKPVFTGH
jgi:hypothetical protein